MAETPKTSLTLLHELAENSDSAQWQKFYYAYRDPIFSFVRANYPSLEPDEIFHDTMQALSKCLPTYQYLPDEKGHFHNFLMGIARHKAVDAIRDRLKEKKKREKYGNDPTTGYHPTYTAREDQLQQWRMSIMETAIAQLMADSSISANTRTVFQHVALMHEAPEMVAAAFGINRNNVDQIKNRMMKKLTAMVQTMMETSPIAE